jgi:leucyl aminopeptidase
MGKTVRLGTLEEIEEFASIVLLVRFVDGECELSQWVPSNVGGMTLPTRVTSEWATRQGLTTTVGSSTTLRSTGPANVTLVSCGAAPTNTLDEWRRIGASAVRSSSNISSALLFAPSDLANTGEVLSSLAEGAILSSYVFSAKDTSDPSELVLIPTGPDRAVDADIEAKLKDGIIVAEAVNWAKELIDCPPSQLAPKELAKRALRRLEKDPHIKVDSWSGSKVEEEKLGGLLGVSLGSSQSPRLVYATYDPQPHAVLPHVALVGKGVTFDSGGLSIKTYAGMLTMKTDMTGAAVVLSVLSAVSRLGLKLRLTVIAPLTENLLGSSAMKPGDVLTIRNGMTIEVLNTDAEGRLILADGLSLAVEAKPDSIIDVATLTGAQAVALGDEVGAIFTNSDDLATAFAAASERSGEALWRLPLVESYESHIDSEIADMKNVGKAGNAGAISAALLLRRFVAETPWVHLDIAGPGRSDNERGYATKGGTAFSARTIIEFLRALSLGQSPNA